MKIYQVHHTGGSYEDYFDMIVASFVSKDKAQDYANKYNKEIQKNKTMTEICQKCPIWSSTKSEYDKNKDELDKYCNKKRLVFDDDDIDCENYFFYYDDDNWYSVKEEDVIE